MLVLRVLPVQLVLLAHLALQARLERAVLLAQPELARQAPLEAAPQAQQDLLERDQLGQLDLLDQLDRKAGQVHLALLVQQVPLDLVGQLAPRGTLVVLVLLGRPALLARAQPVQRGRQEHLGHLVRLVLLARLVQLARLVAA